MYKYGRKTTIKSASTAHMGAVEMPISDAAEVTALSWVTLNHAPATGVVGYTNVSEFSLSLPPGLIAIDKLSGQVALTWDPPSRLQARGSLSSGSCTNVPATSPYVIPASGTPLFFRLTN